MKKGTIKIYNRTVKFKDSVEKKVVKIGNSGGVLVPKKHVGKNAIVLIQEEEKE